MIVLQDRIFASTEGANSFPLENHHRLWEQIEDSGMKSISAVPFQRISFYSRF